MKKVCFVISTNSGLSFSYLGLLKKKDMGRIRKIFGNDYIISFNYLRDKGSSNLLVVPIPFTPIENSEHIPVIYIPVKYFVEQDYTSMKKLVDDYFSVHTNIHNGVDI